nr:zinc finger, CCHC-type [Tanacetum cinerariifolium]
MTNQTVNSLVFRSFFEKEKLFGPNFIDWYCNMRIVLMAEDKLTFLEEPIHVTPILVEGQTINELHAMLKLHEETHPKKEVAYALHTIQAGRIQKNNNNKKSLKAAKGMNQGKGKTKFAYAPNPKIPPPPKKDNPAKDATNVVR